MKNKMHLQKSNKFKNIIIGASLTVSIITGAPNILTILNQQHGININNEAIEQIIVEPKQEQTKTIDNETEPSIENVEQVTEYTPKYDIESLQAQYPDAWAILEKPDGSAFPVVSTTSRSDEDFYTKHAIDGSYSQSGTLFLDYQNDPNLNNRVSRIWGHNLLAANMFGDLTEYQNQGQSFYDQHQSFTLYTINGVYQLDVFAALEKDGTKQNFEYNTNEKFLQDMSSNINNSNFQSNVSLNPDDKVIVLCACPDDSRKIDQNIRFSVYTRINPIYEKNINNSKAL